MANIARIGYAERIRLRRRDELESMRANIHIADRLFDFWHVAGDALAPCAVRLVVRMGLDTRCVRTIGRVGAVAVQAYLGSGLPEDRLIRCAVNIVTAKAGDAAGVHEALHEIVALHAILVRSAVGKVRERLHPELAFLELPEVAQVLTDLEADRPVVILTGDRISERLPLRMALDADVIRVHVIELGWIDDVAPPLVRDVLTARTVAAFAADIPFRHRLSLDVVAHGMAAVA